MSLASGALTHLTTFATQGALLGSEEGTTTLRAECFLQSPERTASDRPKLDTTLMVSSERLSAPRSVAGTVCFAKGEVKVIMIASSRKSERGKSRLNRRQASVSRTRRVN
jgi:hypothetical protein